MPERARASPPGVPVNTPLRANPSVGPEQGLDFPSNSTALADLGAPVAADREKERV
jgi:hypothetical protein